LTGDTDWIIFRLQLINLFFCPDAGLVYFRPMTRKKILWLCSWYPNRTDPFDGDFIQRHARAAALRHDIHVIRIVPDSVLEPGITEMKLVQEPGLTEQLIYLGKQNSLVGRYLFYQRWKKLFRKAITDYIATNGSPAAVHVHVPYPAGRLALWVKKKYGIPFVVTEHWTIYQPGNEIPYLQQPLRLRKLINRVIKETALFLPVSIDLGKKVNQCVAPVATRMIPNVVDTRLFFFRDKQVAPGQVFRFIHVSGMSKQKNPEGLLRSFAAAFRHDPQMELLLLGNRDQSLPSFAKTLGLPKNAIRFGGEVSYAAVAFEMQQADALILFSNVENAPCVISEALCCGLPVVATMTGGIPEMLDATNGILIEPADEAGMKKALLDLKKNHNRYNRAMIAENGKAKYAYEKVADAFSEVYISLAG
jgi:glycosyltransferase involved in cell wall biosynthesis